MTRDVNNDGKLDLIYGGANNPNVFVALNKGGGVLENNPQQVIALPSPPNVLWVDAADFNQDGKLDLAVSNDQVASLNLFFGHGDGRFDEAVAYSTGPTPRWVAIGDANGNSADDYEGNAAQRARPGARRSAA